MGKLLPNFGSSHGAAASIAQSGWDFVEGTSASMRPVEAAIRELAKSDVPVLLLAEPGAGKRSTAQRIHEMSPWRARPFYWLQCARLNPEELRALECATQAPAGAGSFYFDELADLNADCQAQLQGQWPQSADGVRIICGSARDLEREVKAGRLREDLYYRISGVCLRLPPLRQRREDIPVLLRYFLRRYAQEFSREIPELSAETQVLFQQYAWPGNLKELDYMARVLVALGDEEVAMGGLRALLLQKIGKGGNGGTMSLKAVSRAASQEAEKDLILKALTRTRWNRRRAARELQISYKALLYKLKRIRYEGYGAS